MNKEKVKELEKFLSKEISSNVGAIYYSNWLSLNEIRCLIQNKNFNRVFKNDKSY